MQEPQQSIQTLTDAEKIAHLLNRAAFGPWYGDVERIRQIGIEQYVEEQLHPERIPDSDVDPLLPTAPTLPSSIVASPRVGLQLLQGGKLVRAVYSRRQLQEVMTDFWFNHFNVFWGKSGVQNLTAGYEQEAIRPNVFGKFSDLLLATAKHPAMVMYLDNAVSSGTGINENYARELLELHTMGVDGGYTQEDVQEVARCFTGWTVDNLDKPTAFEFREANHTPGRKVVLGHIIEPAGYKEGEAVLELIARHPSTARFIASKLVRRLVADDPPPALVTRVADIFNQTNGDIREMLRAIFRSPEFFSPQAFRSKTKSPFEYIVSAVRGINGGITTDKPTLSVGENGMISISMPRSREGQTGGLPVVGLSYGASSLLGNLEQMGQFLYQCEPPTGYPDRSDFWMGGWAVMHRVRFAAALAGGNIAGVSVDANQLRKFAESDWKTALSILQGVSDARAASQPTEEPNKIDKAVEAFALALGSPDFQRK